MKDASYLRPSYGTDVFAFSRCLHLSLPLWAVFDTSWGDDLGQYAIRLLRGFIEPVWPNGGWSIAVELHFYVLLPILLLMSRRSVVPLVLALMAALLFRTVLWNVRGEIQSLSYWTLVGCFDYFVLGIIGARYRGLFAGRTGVAVGLLVILLGFVYSFDLLGGFYGQSSYPSTHAIWIYFPTVVGPCFAGLIAWCDTSGLPSTNFVSRTIAAVGASSYSIYLLHFFVVFPVSRLIDRHLFRIEGDWIVIATSFALFMAFAPVAYASFRFIELPLLRFRRPYLKQ